MSLPIKRAPQIPSTMNEKSVPSKEMVSLQSQYTGAGEKSLKALERREKQVRHEGSHQNGPRLLNINT